VTYQKTDFVVCDEDRDIEFEVTPDSQLFDVLSSDSDGAGGFVSSTGMDLISQQNL